MPGINQFLLTCLLRGMTLWFLVGFPYFWISTHMPLARHDLNVSLETLFTNISTHMPLARHDLGLAIGLCQIGISTHMPLARHDTRAVAVLCMLHISTHMPLARHDIGTMTTQTMITDFYSHASCEA